MHKDYEARGLKIVGFPCNQFRDQEPGTAEEIRKFVDGYGVTFPLSEKLDVNGPDTHDVFKYLRNHSSLYDDNKKAAK